MEIEEAIEKAKEIMEKYRKDSAFFCRELDHKNKTEFEEHPIKRSKG